VQTPTSVNAVNQNGDAVASLRPEMYPRRLMRLVITGPKGSRCDVYLGNLSPSGRIDQTSRGQSNTNEFTNPLTIPAGMYVFAVWPGRGSAAAQASATFLTERA
jgi:hypothetical protein